MSLVEHIVNDSVMTITLNDETRRNALSDELLSELVTAIDTADADPNVRVVIVTNSGTVFSAGANLRERSSTSAPTVALSDLFLKIRNSPKIFVGALPGTAWPAESDSPQSLTSQSPSTLPRSASARSGSA